MKSTRMRPIYFLLYIAFFTQACQNPKTETGKASDNSQATLDWQGTYTGVLPCADCEGIETILTLNRNLKYTLSTKYIGKDEQALQGTGTFRWDTAASMILLNDIDGGPAQYLVRENELIQLDSDGNRIKGSLAERYILRETIESILASVRWNLIELMGKYLESSSAHIRFDPEINLINGYGWCNTFSGTYEFLENRGHIKFSEMIPTSKVCPDTTIEKQLLNMFRAIDTYKIDGKFLSLSRSGATPLAKFEAIRSVR